MGRMVEDMLVRRYRVENFEWARIPEDLNRHNLALIVAKTTQTTVHPTDVEYPVRIFKESELEAAARSLARREIGLNHRFIIDGAFTVDANWNKLTNCVEALVYLPDAYIEKVRSGFINQVSVEYNWRDEHRTEAGVEFEGMVFYRVDLLENVNPGDHKTMISLVESERGGRGLMEGDISLPCDKKECVHCGECGPETDIKDELIQDCIDDPELSFFKECHESAMQFLNRLGEPFANYKDFADCKSKNSDKSNPDAYCGHIQHQVEDKKKKEAKEAQIPEKPMNPMANEPGPMSAIFAEPKVSDKPDGLMTSIGAVSNPMGMESKDSGIPVKGGEVKVVDEGKSKQRVESADLIKDKPKGGVTVVPADKDKPKDGVAAIPAVVIPADAPNALPAAPVVEVLEVKALKESLAAKESEVKQLQDAVDKMQKNMLDSSKAIKTAKDEGRKEMLEKVESVLPDSHKVSGWSQGGQILAKDIRKILYESKD